MESEVGNNSDKRNPLWKDGIICAYERVELRGTARFPPPQKFRWLPIGWKRLNQLTNVASHSTKDPPKWWLNISADDIVAESVSDLWLRESKWLTSTVRERLLDAGMMITDEDSHYQIPRNVNGGVLFELFGYKTGGPLGLEDLSTLIVLRSFSTSNMLLTVMHAKGDTSLRNVSAVTKAQQAFSSDGTDTPTTVQQLIARLAFSLCREDDRVFSNSKLATDGIALKLSTRERQVDKYQFNASVNEDIYEMQQKVILSQWLLYHRKKTLSEFFFQWTDDAAKSLLDKCLHLTTEMLNEQDAVAAKLLDMQKSVESSVRSLYEARDRRASHRWNVLAAVGLFLSIVAALFGINIGGIPGANSPHAFIIFVAVFCVLGVALYTMGVSCFGLKEPVIEKEAKASAPKAAEIPANESRLTKIVIE